ncbi:MAG: holo-ACP synthase [Cyanobacteria bacterium P01_C01_bin.89]
MESTSSHSTRWIFGIGISVLEPRFWSFILELLLGTDIVQISRIQRNLDRFNQRFIDRIYTLTEQQDCWRRSPLPSLNPQKPFRLIPPEVVRRFAGRWAAKEAIVKALGTGWTGINYRDVSVKRLTSGAPCPNFSHSALAPLKRLDPNNCALWRLSLTHDGDYAMATAIAIIPPQ